MAPMPKGFPHPKDAVVTKIDIQFNFDPKVSGLKITTASSIDKGAKGVVDTVTGDLVKLTVQSGGEALKMEMKLMTFFTVFQNLTNKN